MKDIFSFNYIVTQIMTEKSSFSFLKKAAYFILLLAVGCAEENPLLVNPQPQHNFVNLRLINLASDGNVRILNFDKIKETEAVPFASASPTIKPPQDSSIYYIKNNGSDEFKSKYRQRFMRNYNYTFVAVPTEKHLSQQKAVDTVIVFTSSISIQPGSLMAYVKFFNGYPDTTVRYSLRSGCQSGVPIASQIPYRSVTTLVEVLPDTAVVSLIKHENNTEILVGLYKFHVNAAGQYAVILSSDQNGNEQLQVLNEMESKAEALKPAEVINERTSMIRPINFSSSGVNVKKAPDETIAEFVQPGFISAYSSVEACGALTKDKIIVSRGQDSVSDADVSLEVLAKYTVLVFDSAQAKANKAILIKPERYDNTQKGKAFVRTVHAGFLREGLTLSLGARYNSSSKSRFITGEVLANQISYGNVTGYVAIDAGYIPMNLFSATQPAKLLRTAYSTLEPDKKYLIVITNSGSSSNVKDNIYLISEDDENKSLVNLNEGYFAHVVHALPGADSISVSLGEHITNARLLYTSSLSTVLPNGQSNLHISDYKSLQKDTVLNPVDDLRILNIVSGNSSEMDLISYSTSGSTLQTTTAVYKRRFINACREIQFTTTIINTDTLHPIDQRRLYRTASSFAEVGGNPQTLAFVYFNADKPDSSIYRVEDVQLQFSKAYSLIFCGSKASGRGYSLIDLQEY